MAGEKKENNKHVGPAKNAETSKPGGICSEMLRHGGIEMSEELKEEYRNETMRLIKLISSEKRLRSLYTIALQMAKREEKERDECEN